ncbi:Centrosomal protein of 162 kDa [Eumeta japonica]|uniref:Centrosomal protein of 162 kDa n=1 Tax=Eumeta variegata TaxID=151549 RepID=A0A4C1WIC0_EUMVA|nr:Centrosomal protein of 162 kDa [Eumeta japonica]
MLFLYRQGIPTAKHATKENTHDARRKTKLRPFSAGVLDTRKREVKARTVSGSPKKPSNFKQESILEDLKDTNERAKSLELFNVKLTEDNKNLRKRLAQVEEEKHIVDLKLAECENLISKLGREFDNRNLELKAIKENESRLLVELNRERNDRKNLTIQRDKDVNVIQDLQRQCKEMEMILKRKHPDSVSALIVAAKSSTVEDNKKKLLEERIARLEQELKDKEDHFQHILVTLQEKFTDMKQKYESHIIDVERQLMGDRKLNSELRSRANKFETVESATQTLEKVKHAIGTQTRLRSADAHSSTVSRLTQSSSIILNKLKEDSYLVATIKGLQTELTTKQRTIAKINRETEELKKNLRNLRKEKEVLMNLNLQKKGTRQKKSVETILGRVNTELESELAEARQQAEMMAQERNSLLDSLKWTNEELILLKRKRIQDSWTTTSFSRTPYEFKEGRPKSVVIPENLGAMRKLIMQDRHVTYREIKAPLDIKVFEKIRKTTQRRSILHRDNASCRTSAETTLFLDELKGHPPYSPDSAPNDFYLLPSVKNKLRGQRFSSREEAVLHTLQLAHEKELMQMNMQLTPLQEEIQMLNRTVEILQARVRSADEKLVRYQVGVRDVEINGSGDACAARNSAKK